MKEKIINALQELKEAKKLRNNNLSLGFLKRFQAEQKEKNAMKKLIDIHDHEKGGLLISPMNKYFLIKGIADDEQKIIINQTFYEIYRDIDNLKDMNSGYAWCLKIFTDNCKDFVRAEITARGDGSPHKVSKETKAQVSAWLSEGRTYKFIGENLSISYEDLKKYYKNELDKFIPKNKNDLDRVQKYYFIESRKQSGSDLSNDFDKEIDDYDSSDFEKDYEEDESLDSSEEGLTNSQRDVVDCMQENFRLFAIEEPDRALAIALRHQDVYNPRASYLKEALKKFMAPIRTITESASMKMNSKEIGIIIGKNAANVDVYINESKKKLQPFIEKCKDLLTLKR